MEIPPADICISTSCKSVSAYCRGKNSIPSHPRHDCLRCRSIRTNALLESDRAHSTEPVQSRCIDADQRCRLARLHSIEKRVSERDRAGSTPKRSHMGCNPREPFPKPARSDRAPSASSVSFSLLIRKAGFPLLSSIVSFGISLPTEHSEQAGELIGKLVTGPREYQIRHRWLFV